MPVLKYKTIDPSKIGITKPIKYGGVYSSDVFYSWTEGSLNEPLVIQTPSVKINSGGGSLEFKLVNKGYLFTMMEDLSEKIIDIIYTNSKLFFNGKEFSEKRIRQSLKKIAGVSDSGVAVIRNTHLSKNIKYYDDNKNEIASSAIAFPLEGSCIIHIDRVIFDKKSIDISIEISHVKVTPIKKKILDCILEDSDTETDRGTRNDEKTGDICKDILQDTVSPDNVSPSGEIPELNTVVKDFDNLEFFED